MMRNLKTAVASNLLDQFRCKPNMDTRNTLITTCPKMAFRVNPDPDSVLENLFVVYKNNRWHLVDNEFYLKGIFLKGLLRADIYDCLDQKGQRFLLISTYPLSTDMTSWRESVELVVEMAREDWVTMQKGHQRYGAYIDKTKTITPYWPKEPFDGFVLEAFGDHVITLYDYPEPAPVYPHKASYRRNGQVPMRDDF